MNTAKFSTDKNGCWNWLGAKLPTGYGLIGYNYKTHLIHRFLFNWCKGQIPPGKVLDHLCKNKSCANPWHLEAVSQRTNVRRGVACKISDEQRKKILDLSKKGLSGSQIGELFGLHRSTIHSVIKDAKIAKK